jgi:hypothetical protein
MSKHIPPRRPRPPRHAPPAAPPPQQMEEDTVSNDERYEALSDPEFLERYGDCTLTVEEERNGLWSICCDDQVNAITHFDDIEEAFEWMSALRKAVERDGALPAQDPKDLEDLEDDKPW